MEQVPKIVRERLKVPTAVANHPDADVLTAFSERSLPELERAIVLEHLARCGECREVLALSLPATETVQPVLQPSPQSWFAWPALRWGFVAAGVLLVGSIGVLQYRKQTRSSTMAYRTASPAVSQDESRKKATEPSPTSEPAAPADSESATRTDALTLESPVSRKKLTSPNTQGVLTAVAPAPSANRPFNPAVLPHGPRVANQQLNSNFQQNTIANQSAQALAAPMPSPKQSGAGVNGNPPPAASQAVEVAGAAPLVSAQPDDVHSLTVQSQSLDQQKLHGGLSESKADTTRPPMIGYSASSKVPGRSNSMGAVPNAPNARWSITSSGTLQRSTDQGNSWQDVNVADNSAASPASLMLTAKARAKELDDKDTQNEKIERSKALPIVFRAVSANGPDVWAGGSAGTLYHSTDAGAHWIRIIPATPISTLTGEILTLAFSDPQHGRISTSTSEVWTTTNGGLTWQKQ